jgi:HK97 family phage portal protein
MKLRDRWRLWRKHRGSEGIYEDEGTNVPSSYNRFNYETAYNTIEVVNRGTNLVVDSAAEVNTSITGRLKGPPRFTDRSGAPVYVRQKLLDTILNYRPNDFENIDEFRRQLVLDLVLTGNCYQYFDGMNLWHLPSKLVEVLTGKNEKVTGYKYNGDTTFTTSEIIHTKDNSAKSVITGESRLRSAFASIQLLDKMRGFQSTFFDNGAVGGLLLTTDNVLGVRMKERMIQEFIRRYSVVKKGRRPMILDAGLTPHMLTNQSFRELDFESSTESHEKKILKALGVPPLLLDSGNNANIAPNLKLFYENTVLPISSKIIASYEAFFAYDLEPDVFKVRALRPELQQAGQFFGGMVNNGIMTINEARLELRLPPSTEEHADKLRIPQNIAGSAENPTEGGRPPEDEDSPEEGDDAEQNA